ncbi:YEATS domain-containing protein 2-like [Limulus polyphemus]|uniref:YEATS domain-containing protein 2-like n=1 Tax=Limulus polyphemus TaxID=6850 RepID=A0ABM1BBR4_LIMPO|nr:YEATS domain-containing protein 2-like [Limulus polyphemus]
MDRKRSFVDLDPDYTSIDIDSREKKLRVCEEDAKKVNTKKIKQILVKEIEEEISYKEVELDRIDKMLSKARIITDRLRACIIAKYYSSTFSDSTDQSYACANTSYVFSSVHPTLKKQLGKCIPYSHVDIEVDNRPKNENENYKTNEIIKQENCNSTEEPTSVHYSSLVPTTNVIKTDNMASSFISEYGVPVIKDFGGGRFRFKEHHIFVVGNVSRYIAPDSRPESDKATHKWMVYVRGTKEHPDISGTVRKVLFFLHPSYRPNDLVEINSSPFQLIRRGWGEFPVRVQLHFWDTRNRPVDVIHNLKLDKTYTGLQTLGAETVFKVWLLSTKYEDKKLPVPLSGEEKETTNHDTRILSSEKTEEGVPDLEECNSIPQIETTTQENMNDVKKEVMKVSSIQNQPLEKKEIPNQNNDKASTPNNQICSSINTEDMTHFYAQNTLSLNATTSVKTSSITQNKKLSSTNVFIPCLRTVNGEKYLILVPSSSLPKIPTSTLQLAKPESSITEGTSDNCVKTIQSSLIRSVTTTGKNTGIAKSVPKKPLQLIVVSKKASVENSMVTGTEKASQLNDLNFIHLPECKTSPTLLSNTLVNKHNKGLIIDKESTLKLKEPPCDPVSLVKSSLNEHVCVDTYSFLKHLLKLFPLVNKDVDRSIHPYCASSLEQFFSWTLGKQRASEWQRARHVHQTALQVVEEHDSLLKFKDEIGNTKKIAWWCRKFGFTPLALKARSDPFLVDLKHLTTYSMPDNIINHLVQDYHKVQHNIEEVNVDVVTVQNTDDNVESKKGKLSIVSKVSSHLDTSHFHIPCSSAAEEVRNIAAEIGVQLEAQELCPPVKCSVLEEMLLSACREFASDILRIAISKYYERMSCHPDIITVSDIFQAIQVLPENDFITNSNLGTLHSNVG